MSWVFTHSQAKLGSRLVLLSIANYAKMDGTGAWPSIATIAKDSRLSETQTHRCIKKLRVDGELTVKVSAGPSGTNLYDLAKMRGSHLEGEGGAIRASQMAPNPLGTIKNKSPLPPASGGIIILEWAREKIEVKMGRRKRLPSFESFHGARADSIVEFLRGKGFNARIMEAKA